MLAPLPVRPPTGVIIGADTDTGEPVYLDSTDLKNGLALLGKNGTGKSVLVEILAWADMKARRGPIVIDPHGDLVDNLCQRVPDELEDHVVLLDASAPTPFGVNMYYCPTPADPDLVDTLATRVTEVFRKVLRDDWGVFIGRLIPNTAYLLLANSPHFTMLDIPRVLQDGALRGRLLSRVSNQVVRRFWEREYDLKNDTQQAKMIEALLARLEDLTRSSQMQAILGQKRATLDFSRWMEEKRIVLVKLPEDKLGEHNVGLLGTILVRQIITAAMDRIHRIPERQRHQIMFYADEFHQFASPDFGKFIDQARKTGVNVGVAHQHRAQLIKLGLGDVGKAPANFVWFQVSGDSALDVISDIPIRPTEGPKTPAMNTLDVLKRGHRNPAVFELSTELDRMMDRVEASIARTASLRDSNSGWVRASGKEAANELKRTVNFYLYQRMRGTRVGADRLGLAINRFFMEGGTGGAVDYEELVEELGDLLARPENFIRATGALFDEATRGQLKQDTLDRLVDQPELHAIVKLKQPDKTFRVRHIRVEPLPWADDPDKRARIIARARERDGPPESPGEPDGLPSTSTDPRDLIQPTPSAPSAPSSRPPLRRSATRP